MTKPKQSEETGNSTGPSLHFEADIAAAASEETVTYKVIGPHRVDGVKRPGTLELDPDDERTKFLLRVGHIAPHNQED